MLKISDSAIKTVHFVFKMIAFRFPQFKLSSYEIWTPLLSIAEQGRNQ